MPKNVSASPRSLILYFFINFRNKIVYVIVIPDDQAVINEHDYIEFFSVFILILPEALVVVRLRVA